MVLINCKLLKSSQNVKKNYENTQKRKATKERKQTTDGHSFASESEERIFFFFFFKQYQKETLEQEYKHKENITRHLTKKK